MGTARRDRAEGGDAEQHPPEHADYAERLGPVRQALLPQEPVNDPETRFRHEQLAGQDERQPFGGQDPQIGRHPRPEKADDQRPDQERFGLRPEPAHLGEIDQPERHGGRAEQEDADPRPDAVKAGPGQAVHVGPPGERPGVDDAEADPGGDRPQSRQNADGDLAACFGRFRPDQRVAVDQRETGRDHQARREQRAPGKLLAAVDIAGDREQDRQQADDERGNLRPGMSDRDDEKAVERAVAQHSEENADAEIAGAEAPHPAGADEPENDQRGRGEDEIAADGEIDARIGRDAERRDEDEAPKGAGAKARENTGEHRGNLSQLG